MANNRKSCLICRIDRILYMIRRASFVIADLSNNNDGVCHEAGFARGLNIEVIYLVKEGTAPHFEVSGINQVRWKSEEQLRTCLKSLLSEPRRKEAVTNRAETAPLTVAALFRGTLSKYVVRMKLENRIRVTMGDGPAKKNAK